ncbi:hypothetical protein R1sor_016751 [Riccia sorocarpa]|uniref:AB hydrolase-1 domain-containing protein n=1 Tax=Riccia sorocarpa TaxID=122646 RepID=A0ABD3HIP4_9MARC
MATQVFAKTGLVPVPISSHTQTSNGSKLIGQTTFTSTSKFSIHQLMTKKTSDFWTVAAASDKGLNKTTDEGEDEMRTKGIFSFVTDNESSRTAIQMPNTPVQDGNLGQMITAIENKGRDFGAYRRAGEFSWWVRTLGDNSAKKGIIVLLHGAPAQSYSYRDVMKQLAAVGYQVYAPDWLGYGFSEKPQPGYDFKYTEEAYHEEFDKLLVRLKIDSPFYLLTQAPLPSLFQQLRIPFLGEFTCQNAILPERFVEEGSPYVLELDDADVYRLPYLDSSDPGFSLLESVRKAPVKDLGARIASGFADTSWKVPTIVAWGEADKYLPKTEAEEFAKNNPEVIRAVMLSGAGHLPQEDWPEKVVEAVDGFFQRA